MATKVEISCNGCGIPLSLLGHIDISICNKNIFSRSPRYLDYCNTCGETVIKTILDFNNTCKKAKEEKENRKNIKKWWQIWKVEKVREEMR